MKNFIGVGKTEEEQAEQIKKVAFTWKDKPEFQISQSKLND